MTLLGRTSLSTTATEVEIDPLGLTHPVTAPTAPWPGAPATALDAWRNRVPLRFPRWGLGDAAIALIGGLFLSIAVGVLVLFNRNSTTWQDAVILLSLAAQWVPMLGWPLLATRRKGNGAVLDLGFAATRSDILWGAVGGLAVLVSGTVIGAITQHFTGPFTSTAGDALSSMADNRLMFVLLSLGVGVIAPIVEEVCFRGLLWGSLAKRGMNPWWATAISALIFALFHFEPVRLPLLFATGLILGFLRQRTGRLGAGMLAHMINNSAALLAFALT